MTNLKKAARLQEVVNTLESKKEEITRLFRDSEDASKSAKRATDHALAQMQDAKRRYEASLKEEKDLMTKQEIIKNDLYDIAEDIYLTSLELKNAGYEERISNNATEQKQERQLLANITKKLPEELVRAIGEFLSPSVYIKLMENPSRNKDSSQKSYKTSLLLRKIHGNIANIFLTKICTNPLFLTLLPRKDAICEVPFIQNGTTTVNPDYNPFWETYSALENRMKLTYVLNMAKEKNAKFALEIIKWIHILYNPSKKYDINPRYIRHYYPRDLTMNDVDRLALPDE